MPKPNTELKFSLGTIARQHRMPTLECSGVRVSNVWKGHTVIDTAYVAFKLVRKHDATRALWTRLF